MILADDGAISVTYGQLSSALIQYYPTLEMVRSLHIHREIDKDRYLPGTIPWIVCDQYCVDPSNSGL